eukprot:4970601-Prymnesium_polylepis.3
MPTATRRNACASVGATISKPARRDRPRAPAHPYSGESVQALHGHVGCQPRAGRGADREAHRDRDGGLS